MHMSNIGEQIKLLRTAAKLSQIKFAEAIGVTQGFLSRIEKGQHQPTSDLLIRIANTFNTNINWLLLDKGKMFLKEEESTFLSANLKKEHLLLINAYEAAEEPIKEAALIMLKNSAEKSESTDRKDSDCQKMKSG